jgi:3-isopropylmalate dehydrogenase
MNDQTFRIVVLPGDGIGPEVMQSGLQVLDRAIGRIGGFALAYEHHRAGAELYRETGTDLPEPVTRACERADAILFGSMGLPDVRYPDGTEIAPQLVLRFDLDLYAGVRPVRALPGTRPPLADPRAAEIDFVLVREQSEGWFYGRYHPEVGPRSTEEEAYDIGRTTRAGSERLFEFAFRLARKRRARNPKKGRVTCVDKANVHRSLALFHRVFWDCAKRHPDIGADHAYVDAMALNFVRKPWEYDVLPTENQFGDILSDLGAGLIGGMGLAPSGDIGDEHGLFQPAHGTAPDIAGEGIANPTAMILSAAMMLDWLGERHGLPQCVEAAAAIERAVDQAFATGKIVTPEFGGRDGTAAVTRAVVEALGAR